MVAQSVQVEDLVRLDEAALFEREPIEALLEELDQAQVEGVELLSVVRVGLLQSGEVVLAQPLDLDRAADLGLAAEDADGREVGRPLAIDHLTR